MTLGSDNDGVVESALALVTQMRIVLPQDDMREIELVVNQLALKGNTPVIRYKSYLAVQVFASPDLFRQVARTDFPSGDDFFASIASRLQQSMLGYTSK